MNSNLIFCPVLTQIMIPIAGFMLPGVRIARALKTDNVDINKTALGNDAWPDHVPRPGKIERRIKCWA